VHPVHSLTCYVTPLGDAQHAVLLEADALEGIPKSHGMGLLQFPEARAQLRMRNIQYRALAGEYDASSFGCRERPTHSARRRPSHFGSPDNRSEARACRAAGMRKADVAESCRTRSHS